MTNEELVLAVQQGDSDKMPQLWTQIERLVSWKANKLINALGDNCPVEFDDLYNSGYIALCNAVERYDPEHGAFSTHFMLHLKTAFAEATGYRSEKQRRDPLHRASSFDDPVPGTDNLVLGDLIPDGTDLEGDTVEKIWQQQLHDALDKALGTLDPTEEQTLRTVYYDGQSLAELAESIDIPYEKAKYLHHKALGRMRRGEARKCIEPYIDRRTNFYLRTGASSYESPVELLAIQREELRNMEIYIQELRKKYQITSA